jgi:hypothetical protein
LKHLSSMHLARVGAIALLTAGALVTTAVPASAAAPETDFALTLTGTTIAANASGKFGSLTVTNLGTATPKQVDLRFDLADLDLSKVELDLGDCDQGVDEIRCGLLDEFVPGPEANADLDLPFVRAEGATGSAGTLTAVVEVAGDSVAGNNSVTVQVSVGEVGVDLDVVAEDVHAVNDAGELTGDPVAPGEVTALVAHVLNQGDRTAEGVQVWVKLPEHVSFAEKLSACTYSGGGRIATCRYADLDLIPADLDDPETFLLSGRDFWFMVQVDDDAAVPVLKKGLVRAHAVRTADADAASVRALRKQKPQYDANVRAHVPGHSVRDTDETDNTDEFSVFVALEESGGSGGGGGLPVTGPQAAVLGGGGLAVAVAGALLFLSARRRRVVLVTPGDERAPTG